MAEGLENKIVLKELPGGYCQHSVHKNIYYNIKEGRTMLLIKTKKGYEEFRPDPAINISETSPSFKP